MTITKESLPQVNEFIKNVIDNPDFKDYLSTLPQVKPFIFNTILLPDPDYFYLWIIVDPTNISTGVLILLDKTAVEYHLQFYKKARPNENKVKISKYYTILRNFGYVYLPHNGNMIISSESILANEITKLISIKNIQQLRKNVRVKEREIKEQLKRDNYIEKEKIKEEKFKQKQEKVKELKQTKTKAKYYVDDVELKEELRKSIEQDRVTERLGALFILIVDKYFHSRYWKNVSEKAGEMENDYKATALYNLCRYYKNFDLSRNTSPLAYITTITDMAFRTHYGKELYVNGSKNKGFRAEYCYDLQEFANIISTDDEF